MRRSSLTGAWSGAYRYPGDVMPETVFSARIDEQDGAFVGAVEEPNLFVRDSAAVLTADIEGVRSGDVVTFTKFYHHGGIRHAVRYEGFVDGELMRIEGAWIIPEEWSGTFFMTREDHGAEEAAELEAEATLETKR